MIDHFSLVSAYFSKTDDSRDNLWQDGFRSKLTANMLSRPDKAISTRIGVNFGSLAIAYFDFQCSYKRPHLLKGMIMENRVELKKSWALLKNRILQITPSGSGTHETEIKGFAFHRQVSNQDPKPHFFQPVIIVVAQGKKMIKIGGKEYHYGENICFVSGVDMPVTSCVMEASDQNPYLSMSLYLDTGLIADLASKVLPPPFSGGGLAVGAMTQEVEPDLLDAFLRLAELAQKPKQIAVMEELLLREIHFRLLSGPFGNILRSLNTQGSQGYQISRAISL